MVNCRSALRMLTSGFVRESAAQEKVKEAYLRLMLANHPDSGGSDYLSTKVNEAKNLLLGQNKGSASAF